MDGFGAAWAARKVYPDAEFRAVSYQELPPDVSGRNVVIVDFSYKRNVLEEMYKKAQTLRVFDHHKTAWEELSGLPFCYFNEKKSGARIVWDMLVCSPWDNNPSKVPDILLYIEDRDLWKFELPNSKEINAALGSYPKDFAMWDELEKKNLEELKIEGAAILRYQNQIIESLVQNADEMEISGHKILAVNAPILQSEVGHKLAQGRPFGAVWYEHQGKRKFSLRSTKEGVDVAEIAKQYGGGGHRSASGYSQ